MSRESSDTLSAAQGLQAAGIIVGANALVLTLADFVLAAFLSV